MASFKNNINLGIKIDPKQEAESQLNEIIKKLNNKTIDLKISNTGNTARDLKTISDLLEVIKGNSKGITLENLNSNIKTTLQSVENLNGELTKTSQTKVNGNLTSTTKELNDGIEKTIKVTERYSKTGTETTVTLTNNTKKYNETIDKTCDGMERLSKLTNVDSSKINKLNSALNMQLDKPTSELSNLLKQVKELEKEEAILVKEKNKDAELNIKLSNSEFLSSQKNAYSQLTKLLNEEYSIKTKLINAGKKESEVLEQQLIANKLNQQSVNTNINNTGLSNRQREIELTNQQIKLQEQLNLSKSKKIDNDNSKTIQESEVYKKEQQQVKELINQQTRLLEIKKQSLNRQYGDKIDTASIDQAIQKLRSMNNLSLNGVRSEIKNTNISIKELEENVKSSEGIFSRLGNVLGNFGIYLDIGSVIGTFTNSIRSAYDYISYLDSSFTDMNMTMSISKNQFEAMSSEIDELSKSLGITIEDAHDIGKLLPILYSNI